MTPEQAQHILAHIDRLKLTDLKEPEARDALATIANMTPEYSVQLADGRLVGAGWGTREAAECDRDAWQRDGYNARIACRYVTVP